MVVVSPPPPTLSADVVSLFYVVDELLSRSPVLIFYGASATPTATANNSRIQAHIFTPAGFQSFPRLTISPTSPLYSAVRCLPREEQGDDICRGLAFSLYKYFAELDPSVKHAWEKLPDTMGRLRSAPTLFGDSHAAILASRMVKVENINDVIKDIRQALAEQSLSWLDLDVVLPPGSMHVPTNKSDDDNDDNNNNMTASRYGALTPLVQLFGEVAFLPTSRLRRAPSKPTLKNSSASFSRKQKEIVRREMCELLDTEESYVSKLYDLLHSVAEDFRQKAKDRSSSSSSPSEEALKGLFPESLDQILETNSAFLEALRSVVEETENDAIQDIEESSAEDDASFSDASISTTDPSGVVSLAACLRTWFPKFGECYVDYMQAHSQFSQFLKVFMKETGSSFSKRMQETGEQRLMSMLIEPVQRLPRYNLYIDNIVKQLPLKHPAVKFLLNARDMISGICSQDSATIPPFRAVDNLRRLVPSWPLSLRPASRLISAVDVVELPPPYHPDLTGARSVPGILLLFTDYVVFLRKLTKSSLSARGLMALVDGQDVVGTDSKTDEISFRQALELSSFDMTEMDGGKMIQLIPNQDSLKHSAYGRPGSRPGSLSGEVVVQVFYLSGPHEGKASRLIEDTARARVEGRFSESERESQKWEVRAASGVDLTFFAAMFEATVGTKPDGRGPPANVRIVVDAAKCGKLPKVEVEAILSIIDGEFYRLEITGPNEFNSKDNLTMAEFLPVLTKRLSNLLQLKNQIRNPSLTTTLLIRNQHVLQSIKIISEDMRDPFAKDRSSRPNSPVKMLSNLFGGAGTSSFRKPHHSTVSLTDMPLMKPPIEMKKPSLDDRPGSKSSVSTSSSNAASEALDRLEDTLASYVLALHARKGNIIGKVLRARANSDELAVNELYNCLLEDPSNYQLAAQADVDVLFSAFEKFMKIAWQDRIGPVISCATWSAIQSKLDCMYPGEFEEFFRVKFGEMSPQNQRALRAMVRLLANLLEGTSNDGDRGILTMSFAEILVPEGNPHEFVSVLDRLVEDIAALLAEPISSGRAASSTASSLNSDGRHRATNSGSLTSNTSLRKKFGLGVLTRKGSKLLVDSESESGSVWRTLSKSKHGGENAAASLSKISLSRPSSIDMGTRPILSPKRPVSRDRPSVLNAFTFEQPVVLTTIGEGQITGPPRKKRRSSLSDLQSLQDSASNTPRFMTPQTPNDSPNRGSRVINESPCTPSPVKQSLIPAPASASSTSMGALARSGSPTRTGSPTRGIPRAISPVKSRPTSSKGEEITTPSHSTARARKDIVSGSGIPTFRSSVGLSERPSATNVRKLPPVPTSADKPAPLNLTPAKLRMQSPQKLRERLQNEQKAVQNAQATLQLELGKISDEIKGRGPKGVSRIAPPGQSRTKSGNAVSNSTEDDGNSNSNSNNNSLLQSKLATLSTKQESIFSQLNGRLEGLAADIGSSLQVSETRARKLDELYREASAENEALYARFNEELARIVGRVRLSSGGVSVGGAEAEAQAEAEMQRRMKELEDEALRLRKDNGRLKREVVGLRAQLKDG